MQAGVGLLVTDVMPMFMIIALDILITMHFSINCSTVICSPTIEFAILREATSETYGPRVYFTSYKFPIYNSSLLFILQSLFSNLYHKNTKNIYLTIFIRSHFCDWMWRDWQPFIALVARFLIVCAGTRWLACYLLLDWYLGSQNWGKYLRYFAASPFPLQGKTNACSRGSNKDLWRRCRGDLRQAKSRFDLPSTSHFWRRCRGDLRQVKIYQVSITNSYPSH